MESVSTKQLRIAELANRYANEGLTNLHQHIDAEWLYASFKDLKRQSSAGVDEENYEAYSGRIVQRAPELLKSFKTGAYKAPAVKRVYIPKTDGKQRPIGIPTTEDKLLQTAVKKVIEPIYENDFEDFSYGFRKGKSQHQALERIWHEVRQTKARHILDADIQDCFGSINHSHLRIMLDKRVKDGVVRRQIDKWQKAGVLEAGMVRHPKTGTPQGGVISPLLSNIYLHEVIDKWYVEIKPQLKGRSFMVRYADDFVMGFEYQSDAKRVMKVIFQRFAKYELKLHPDKTELIEFSPHNRGTFDFLGFTHYWGKSRRGYNMVKRKTSRKRLNRSLKAINQWLRTNRHAKVRQLMVDLNAKLRGHYNYYGITFNSHSIHEYYEKVKRLLHEWLNRRGGNRMNWEIYASVITDKFPILPPKIVHSYV